jgi:hypothetical protein
VAAGLAHDQPAPQQTCNFVDHREDHAPSCRFFISRVIHATRFTPAPHEIQIKGIRLKELK